MKRFFLFASCALLSVMMMNAETKNVSPGSSTIAAAVKNAAAGDVLVLTNGTYTESSVKPTVAITIKAADGAQPVVTLTSRFGS